MCLAVKPFCAWGTHSTDRYCPEANYYLASVSIAVGLMFLFRKQRRKGFVWVFQKCDTADECITFSDHVFQAFIAHTNDETKMIQFYSLEKIE